MIKITRNSISHIILFLVFIFSFHFVCASEVANLIKKNQEAITKNCINYACQLTTGSECFYDNTKNQLKSACEKVKTNNCVQRLCTDIGSFGCDDFMEILDVVKSCSKDSSMRCVDYVCAQLGSFACDELTELKDVLNQCEGTETDCLVKSCESEGPFFCNNNDHVKTLSKSCKIKK